MVIVSWIISILYFIGVLSVLVLVHEWGHFIVAKLCGMRVDDFSLFFGKRLVRLGVRNGTEYNIRSIPMGGFVKIAGMEPDDISNGAPIFRRDPKQSRYAKSLRGLDAEAVALIDFDKVSERIEQAVENGVQEGELTPSGEAELTALAASASTSTQEQRYLELVLATKHYVPDPDGYNQKPLWQRASVIFAGPFMSLAFGYFMFCIMGFTIGLPDPGFVSVGKVIPGKAADRAGMRAGDQITQIDGKNVEGQTSVMQTIQDSAGRTLHIVVLRGKQSLALDAIPEAEKNEKGKMVGRLNLTLDSGLIWKTYPPLEAIRQGTDIITEQVTLTLKALFTKQIRNINQNVAGPIGIATTIHSASKGGFRYILLIGASLSISLGIMNLLPIPILDGGHLMLLAIEGIRRRKLSGREVYAAQLVGLSIIGVLFVLVMYNDIVRQIVHRSSGH